MRREQGLLLGVGMQMLNHADNLRMTGSDDHFFSRWSGYQARELSARQGFAEIGHVALSFPDLFLMLGAAAVFGLGGWRAMNGDITIGTLAGLTLGFILAFLIEEHGLIRIPPDIYFVDRLPVSISPSDILWICGVSLLISLLATIYPARQASGLQPVEAIRHD